MKGVKDNIEQTTHANFTVINSRIDQFSEQVDSNMDILGKAVADNREVFIDVVNRLSEEIRTKNNNMVEDVEKVVAEIENVIADNIKMKREKAEEQENL